MTTLQYEDNGCRKKQIEKERDEFAIGFTDWLIKRETKYFESLKELLEIYKKEKEL